MLYGSSLRRLLERPTSYFSSFLDRTFTDKELEIPGYILFRKDRVGKRGGGIVAYVRSEIPILRRTDMESEDLEIMWLEVKHPRIKPILVAGAYRPPDTNSTTDSRIEANLSQGYFDGKRILCPRRF